MSACGGTASSLAILVAASLYFRVHLLMLAVGKVHVALFRLLSKILYAPLFIFVSVCLSTTYLVEAPSQLACLIA